MKQCVPDDVAVAKFARQQHDWMERFLKGSLDPVEVAQEVLSIMRGRGFNPHTYFKTRKGLYILDTFKERILPKKKEESMPYRGCEGMISFVLPRNMTDQKIIHELLGGMDEVRTHTSTLDQVAEKIDLQPNGDDGELLNNGYANIFYVLVDGVLFAVSVDWISGYREWNVYAWHFGESGKWNAGNRVFRNTTLEV